MAELEQVKVHFAILENVKLVHIVCILFDFLCNKTSDEIRSTNGDAKALKSRHCEYFMIILRVQEGTAGLQGRITLDKVCCPLCVCVLLKRKKQKARPKGVNLKVRSADVCVYCSVRKEKKERRVIAGV